MTNYEYGFIRKCAEYGIDGGALLAKAAQDAVTADAPVTNGAEAHATNENTTSISPVTLGTVVGARMSIPGIVGALGGAGLGAILDRKKRLRGALIGALMGIPAPYVYNGYRWGKNIEKIPDNVANDLLANIPSNS